MARAQSVWASYQAAASALTSPALAEGGEPTSEDVDRLLRHSDELEAALAEQLETDDIDVRELAALQLEAAGAMDVHMANKLAAIDDGEGFVATLSDEQFGDLERILNTPTEDGISALVTPGFDAQASDDAGAGTPTATLTGAMTAAVDGIAKDAVDAATAAVEAMAGVAPAKIAEAIVAKLGDNFQKAVRDAGRWLKEKALALLLKAIRKLLAVFNVDEDAVRKKLEGWVDGLTKEKIQGYVKTLLYDVDGCKGDLTKEISAATGLDDAKAKQGSEELKALAAHWQKRASVVKTLATLLGAAHKWIFKLTPPWPQTAYVAVATLGAGYAILGGGDYLDWNESDGVLDRVKGVRKIVGGAVA